MKDMKCPYCNSYQDVCHDDGNGYSEEKRHEHECSECEKTFIFTTYISFSYESAKADCLNGCDHNLKLSTTYPRKYSMMRCMNCDYKRQPTDNEFHINGINKES